jgi:hypothetical protein
VLAVAMAGQFSDVRLTTAQTANLWYQVNGRVVALNKTSNTSKLRITYQDTLGTRSDYYNGCQFRIVLDSTVLAFFSAADYDGPYGWRMTNGSHTAWGINVPAGPHNVRVDFLRATTATDCLAGWNTIGSFLSVEEIQ